MSDEQQQGKELAKRNKVKLPKLEDLNLDIAAAFKDDQLNLLLNQEPRKEWLQKHPFAKKANSNEHTDYLPIERVEFLLTKIFGQWRPEVLSVGQLFNSVYVTVRLHYLNPVDRKWYFSDGVGAVSVQTDAGATAADMGKIKHDAVMKSLPAAKTYAIKDAAENLGKIFGKDLNRKNAIEYSMTYADDILADAQVIIRIEQLLATSAYDDERKRYVEKELEDGIGLIRAGQIIEQLERSQVDRIASGLPYNQGDIKEKIKKENH